MNIHIVEKLGQSLYPILEVPEIIGPAGNRNRASPVGSEHSRKEPSSQLITCSSEHLHMSPRQYLDQAWRIEGVKWSKHDNILNRRSGGTFDPLSLFVETMPIYKAVATGNRNNEFYRETTRLNSK